jgi:hypothetical protein
MKRIAAVLTTLTAMVLGIAPSATAGGNDGIDWGVANWAAGVQMYDSEPSATDPHVHVRFKRVGGAGEREVRMGERHKLPDSHRFGAYSYTEPVRLEVGQKVVFTTEGALPCEPAKEPMGVKLDMRIKPPGRPWSHWVTYVYSDWFLMDCSDR